MGVLPAKEVAGVLQNDRDQEDLESDGRQVMVKEEVLLHQEERQVVRGPSAHADPSGQEPLLPRLCRETGWGNGFRSVQFSSV